MTNIHFFLLFLRLLLRLSIMNQNEHYLVGLSGGPDSVMLLHYMFSLYGRDRVIATHCNFHLRGEESMRDQHFCEALCSQLNIQLIVQDFDTRRYMAEHKVSLELAARELRYSWWEVLANEYESKWNTPVRIAVGHHRDDSIETLLMNLIRGTGIKGLVGIPANNGRIIRPLLQFSRHEILQYLDQHGLTYITDSSNLENEATRNQIRNLLLPLMEQINPNARDGIVQTMEHLRQTQQLEQAQLDLLFADTVHYTLAGVEWDEWTLPETITDQNMIATLQHYWGERHPNVLSHRQWMYTAIPDICDETHPLATERYSQPFPPFAKEYELFDAEKVQLPLRCRHWQEGDRIQPLGMKGSRLVSDLFTDAHYSPNRKSTTWIVTDASNRILWVVGLRAAEWSKITSHTKEVLLVKC